MGLTEAATKLGSLEDSSFNIITQLDRKADFLYTSAEQYNTRRGNNNPS